MSVLSPAMQQQVEDELVSEGLISPQEFAKLKEAAKEKDTPFFSFLVSEGHITSEALTKTTAHVAKVPYVNLQNSRVDPKILSLLSKEVAERYMAVPLGEMQNRLVVAMLDADNVQAVDFLSNKIGRPLKVYAASEEGIRTVIKQYEADLDKDVASVLDAQMQEDATDAAAKAKNKDKEKTITTIVQDSPISKALNTILEFAAKNRASDIHIEPLEKESRYVLVLMECSKKS